MRELLAMNRTRQGQGCFATATGSGSQAGLMVSHTTTEVGLERRYI
jgi:hypothetical protein